MRLIFAFAFCSANEGRGQTLPAQVRVVPTNQCSGVSKPIWTHGLQFFEMICSFKQVPLEMQFAFIQMSQIKENTKCW